MTILLGPLCRLSGTWIVGATLTLAAVSFASTQQPPQNFILHDAPKPVPDIQFKDDQGNTRELAGFRGNVVLLNIWATWCVPCRREMPSLDRVQGLLGGGDFVVVALSIDRSEIQVVRKFYADVGIRNLAIYVDTSMKASRELGTVGIPATLLIGREGKELGRLIGPAEWDEPDIVEFLQGFTARKAGAAGPTN